MSSQLSASSVRRLLFVATAGVGALAFVPRAGAGPDPASNPPANTATDQPAQNQPNAAEASRPQLPDGFIEKDEDGASGIRSTVVGLTQRAVTKDSYDSFFSGFLSELAKRDEARSQKFNGVNQEQLNATISQIQTEWHNKYGQDFDLSDKNLVFNERFPIVEGEVSDPTAAANNWPVAAYGQAANTIANSDQQQSNTKELTKGRAVAIIRFPAGDGLPELNVSLLHQTLTGWYVDVPVDRTGEQVYNDLSSHLNYIANHQDQWPSDINDGYRMVARQVVGALYGVSAQGATASAQ
jgi:hypothetical protein